MTKHPSLGLVLAFAGIFGLTQPLVMLVQLVVEDRWTLPTARESVIVLAAQLATTGLQIVAGCAIAWRARWAWAALVLYALAAIAMTVIGPLTIAKDAGAAAVIGSAVETLGPVAVVLLAATMSPSATTRRADASALLVVLGMTSLANLVIHNIDTIRWLLEGRTDVGSVVGIGLRLLVLVGIAVLELIAGLRLRAAPLARARRMFFVYVLAGMIARTALAVLGVIYILVEDAYGFRADIRTERILLEVVFLAAWFLMPLMIWFHVRRELRPDHVATEPELPSLLAWSALAFATYLLARPLVLVEMRGPLDSDGLLVALGVLFVTHGVVLAVAGIAALSRRTWTPWIALGAALVGTTTIATMVIASWRVEPFMRRSPQLGPLVMIVVSSAVLAWVYRKPTRDRATLGTVFE